METEKEDRGDTKTVEEEANQTRKEERKGADWRRCRLGGEIQTNQEDDPRRRLEKMEAGRQTVRTRKIQKTGAESSREAKERGKEGTKRERGPTGTKLRQGGKRK
ncbi:hypothetical protein OIU85_028186 [Salix viminalis]|uniref:Uncharacterized protein n=1 Tax=Salix viminalis TaxID=40686 RepID=A0A9Q0QJK1_SALVM|nr:hypothetical protein OIU85_028186 [Salix viminalis]